MQRYADIMAEALAEFERRVPSPKPRKPGTLRMRRPWIAKTCACGRSAWNRTRQCEACYFRAYRRRVGGGVKNKDSATRPTRSHPCPPHPTP